MVYIHKTLYESFFVHRNLFLDTFMIALSVVFLGVMANIRIPLFPVPITMQTFGVFTIAFFFGSRKGLVSLIAYVVAGLLGIGVFSGAASGVGTVFGPTGGYILGFLFAVFYVGYKIEKGMGRNKLSIVKLMVVGNIIIYAFGLIGLWLNFADWSLWKVLSSGLFPFLIGDGLKIIAAMYLFPVLWKGSEKVKG